MCVHLVSFTGIQEILHKTSPSQDQSTRSEFDWKTTTPTTAESSELDIPAASQPPVQPSIKFKPPPLTIPNSATTAADPDRTTPQSLPNDVDDIDIDAPPAPVSASYAVPGSSGTLKETHIFTPNKIHASPPVARTADAEMAACPDFDYEKAAAGIIINENVVKKEYRDVEYNPNLTTAGADDFSDFQSSVPTTIASNPLDSPGFSSDVLQPTKCIATTEPNNSTVINWPKPGNSAADDVSSAIMPTSASMPSFRDSFDVFLSADPIPMSKPDTAAEDIARQLEVTAAVKPMMPKSISPLTAYAKPVIGVSPTDAMFVSSSVNELSSRSLNSAPNVDDDFSDFQCVAPATSVTQPTVVPQTKHSAANSILMPQTLMPQRIASTGPTATLNWPEPGIDPDELARLEAIFPTPKTKATVATVHTKSDAIGKPMTTASLSPPDDDEWSDFVAANPTSQPITHVLSQNINKLQTAKAKTPADDDDWSDFVSNAPITSPVSQWSSAPKFTSWNAPPQFSDWQSGSIYKPPPQFYSATNNAAVTAKTNNGYNYNGSHFNHPVDYNVQSVKSTPVTGNLYRAATTTTTTTTGKTPSISLIPDLGFIAPTKSFSINVGNSAHNSGSSSSGGPTANASTSSNRSRIMNFSGKK